MDATFLILGLLLISWLDFLQREDVPAPLLGTARECEGRGSALVPEIGTERGGEAAPDLLTGGAQGKEILQCFDELINDCSGQSDSD